MDYLTKLPNEVQHKILKDVDPQDLLSLQLCCQTLNNFIKDNRPLFRDLYLARLVSKLAKSKERGIRRCDTVVRSTNKWANDKKRMSPLGNQNPSSMTGSMEFKLLIKCEGS
jgi:hypothetical protein